MEKLERLFAITAYQDTFITPAIEVLKAYHAYREKCLDSLTLYAIRELLYRLEPNLRNDQTNFVVPGKKTLFSQTELNLILSGIAVWEVAGGDITKGKIRQLLSILERPR